MHFSKMTLAMSKKKEKRNAPMSDFNICFMPNTNICLLFGYNILQMARGGILAWLSFLEMSHFSVLGDHCLARGHVEAEQGRCFCLQKL